VDGDKVVPAVAKNAHLGGNDTMILPPNVTPDQNLLVDGCFVGKEWVPDLSVR
jgi:hypothetical protein